MRVDRFAIPGPALLTPVQHQDERGFLSESFQSVRFGELIGMPQVMQENLVFSEHKGTIRGLHAQSPPHAQAKLVAVMSGRILDVAVDVRQGSPTYGQHVAQILTAAAGEMLYMPRGFLHGYATLEPKTLVLYKLDALYAPAAEVAIRFDDPTLAIDWGVSSDAAIISEKDHAAPLFADFASPFTWQDTA